MIFPPNKSIVLVNQAQLTTPTEQVYITENVSSKEPQ